MPVLVVFLVPASRLILLPFETEQSQFSVIFVFYHCSSHTFNLEKNRGGLCVVLNA